MILPSTYDRSHEELVDEVIRVAGVTGGRKATGEVDLGHRGQLEYFRGVLLARLNGAEPPFKKGQTLRVRDGDPGRLVNHLRSRGVLIVERVQYEEDRPQKWWVSFEGVWDVGFKGSYPHEHFEAVGS